MHYDTIGIVGALQVLQQALRATMLFEKTDVNITGTPMAEGMIQLFDINLQKAFSKLDTTIQC